jgi:hypothetical protein
VIGGAYPRGMEGYGFILLIAAVLVVAAVGAFFAWKFEKERREELEGLAGELGWRFDPSRDYSHDEEYACFEIFRRGHSRAAYNTLSGTIELEGRRYTARAGDFTYKVTTRSGKTTSTTTYNLSYLIMHLPWRTPDLLVRREGIFDRIAGVFGLADINFESEEFSRRFHVRSPDRKFAYDVIDPRMMEFLLASNPPVIDIERGQCCIVDGTRRWKVGEFRARLDWIREFFERWPKHLTRMLDEAHGHRTSGGQAVERTGATWTVRD